MTVPGNLSSPLLAVAAAGAAAGANITKSVRLNSGDSAYLNRTPSSAGSNTTWTLSTWVKKTGNDNHIFGAGAGNTPGRFGFGFNGSDKIFAFVIASGSTVFSITTDAVFRDSAAWYHIVLIADTGNSTQADRFKIYVNGVLQSVSGTLMPSSQNTFVNTTAAHAIGRRSYTAADYFNGYLADTYLIDGIAKDATDFGVFDDSGVWQAASYSGTYPDNSFHLFDFANESTVGHDSSGNENDFTANNISTTAGAGNDVLFDVPANSDTSDTGVGGEVSGNYCTWNPLNTSTYTFSNGNLEGTGYGATNQMTSTIGVSSGKWYAEFTLSGSGGSTNTMIGISQGEEGNYPGQLSTSYGYIAGDGNLYNNGAAASYGATYTYGDVIGVALDLDGGTLTFYKNNSTQGQAATGLSGTYFFAARGSSTSGDKLIANWGQRAFTYTAPSGYKALCTANLPPPTIADGSDYFNAITYTGDAVNDRTITTTLTTVGAVWIKNRSISDNHRLATVVQGGNAFLSPNNVAAESNATSVVRAFSNNTFDIGTDTSVNGSGDEIVAWAWDAGTSNASNTDGDVTSTVRVNIAAGFSITTWTGVSQINLEVGHGLGVEPYFIAVKKRNAGTDWVVYHKSIGNTHYLRLNGTLAATDDDVWGDTTPTSSVFTVNASDTGTGTSDTYIAYCFAPVAGYSAIGLYTGNGGTNGTFVHTGFRPAFILAKSSNRSGENWYIWDSKREGYNFANDSLFPNLTNAEGSGHVDILSNGFKLRSLSNGVNGGGDSYVYYAVAENPFQTNGGLAR